MEWDHASLSIFCVDRKVFITCAHLFHGLQDPLLEEVVANALKTDEEICIYIIHLRESTPRGTQKALHFRTIHANYRKTPLVKLDKSASFAVFQMDSFRSKNTIHLLSIC